MSASQIWIDSAIATEIERVNENESGSDCENARSETQSANAIAIESGRTTSESVNGIGIAISIEICCPSSPFVDWASVFSVDPYFDSCFDCFCGADSDCVCDGAGGRRA